MGLGLGCHRGAGLAVNRLCNTEDFGAAWDQKDGLTIGTSGDAGPAGVNFTTVSTYEEDTSTGFHLCNQNGVTGPGEDGRDICFSVYVKQNGRTEFYLSLQSDVVSGSVFFDIDAGTVGTENFITGGIIDAGSGWYRCYVTTQTDHGGNSIDCDTSLAIATEDVSYTGVSGNGVHITAAMLEWDATTPSKYNPPTGCTENVTDESSNDLTDESGNNLTDSAA